MAAFHYKAAGADGKLIEGQIDAADRDAAARSLLAQGSTPIEIDDARPRARSNAGRRRVTGNGRVSGPAIDYFTLELATLLRAGLPLGQALDTLTDTTDDPALTQRVKAAIGMARVEIAAEKFVLLFGGPGARHTAFEPGVAVQHAALAARRRLTRGARFAAGFVVAHVSRSPSRNCSALSSGWKRFFSMTT